MYEINGIPPLMVLEFAALRLFRRKCVWHRLYIRALHTGKKKQRTTPKKEGVLFGLSIKLDTVAPVWPYYSIALSCFFTLANSCSGFAFLQSNLLPRCFFDVMYSQTSPVAKNVKKTQKTEIFKDLELAVFEEGVC